MTIGPSHSCVYEVRDILVLLLYVLCTHWSVTERFDLRVCILVGGASLDFTLFIYMASRQAAQLHSLRHLQQLHTTRLSFFFFFFLSSGGWGK